MSRRNKRGFTIIELSLSIAFIAILSITMVLIITNTISTYRRGLMLNQINTTGMDLVDDLRAAVQNSSADFIEDICGKRNNTSDSVYKNCVNYGKKNFVSLTKYAKVFLNGKVMDNSVPVFGAFCTGSYSYIWNSGYLMKDLNPDYSVDGVKDNKSVGFKYRNEASEVITYPNTFRLLKILDEGRDVCVAATKAAATTTNGYNVSNAKLAQDGFFDISGSDYSPLAEEPVELLPADADGNMILYDLTASTATNEANDTMLYSVSFILGTIQGGINIKKTGNSCATPGDYEIENFDYCSINKFNFAAQANGA